MQLIYSSKPENRAGFFLLLLSITASITFIFIIIEDYAILRGADSFQDFLITIPIFLIILGWIYFILDEAIWQLYGTEQCICNSVKITIIKRRIICRRREFLWQDINGITFYSPNKIWEIISYFSISGIQQDTISIYYGKGAKYTCGVNLNKCQAQQIIKTLNNIKNNSN